ncbi:riboflavin kinase / FMN adenylyltransferase [Abditibacterium utsteinense]|uniref:Riboflavin biosynthesis protein n=1 Tax=Abditibacterium utsteinense TaxID=1960156 RepID=A0A2S8STB3_9BACT|nr:riboflavin biosynthesis protein RibF [Abditibacterium utsteinense]PQV64037.1 riboflavin kinase / FMN adenylyltransferase [Abditibacterium utsteinense]
MQVHRVLPPQEIIESCALTVGTFDGVHRGHQTLIARLKREADLRDLPCAALTFVDMPYCLFKPDECSPLLTLADEKIEAFAQTPLDHLFIVPFTREIANQSAREFMSYWREVIGLSFFVGGPDFALGRGREGDISALKLLGAELGFETLALEGKLLENGAPISSTRSRGIIEAGQVELARQFLGRPYKMAGHVVSGDQIGRKIGVPTINILPHERKCVPKNGVYAIRATFENEVETRAAVLNIGMRPTVGGLKKQIEFHVLDANIETPPNNVEIEFVARLRDERKFDGLDALVAQMKLDFGKAREIFSSIPG